MTAEERAKRFVAMLPRASDRTDPMLHYIARMSGQSDSDHLADEFNAHAAEMLEELLIEAANLKHPDDAIINWDHRGNDKRSKFYQNHIAHAWIQAGKAMADSIGRKLSTLRPGEAGK